LKIRKDETALTAAIIRQATQYGRYGYRRIRQMFIDEGWRVSASGWRWEGLKVPQKQPKRGHLWLADGSCIRLRPDRANHAGHTILSMTAPRTVNRFACLSSSTSSRGDVWRLLLHT
jgi:hypothetical protein